MKKITERIYKEFDSHCSSRFNGSCVNKNCSICAIEFTVNYLEKELKKGLTVKNK